MDTLDDLQALAERNELSEHNYNRVSKKLKRAFDADAAPQQRARDEAVIAMACQNPYCLIDAECAEVAECLHPDFLRRVLAAKRRTEPERTDKWAEDLVEMLLDADGFGGSVLGVGKMVVLLLATDSEEFFPRAVAQLKKNNMGPERAFDDDEYESDEDADDVFAHEFELKVLNVEPRMIGFILSGTYSDAFRRRMIDAATAAAPLDVLRTDEEFQKACGLSAGGAAVHQVIQRQLEAHLQRAVADARPSSPCAPGGSCSFNEDRLAR